jgi:two-component system LytT family response regulator
MSEKLRVAVVEDEPPARLGLRALLLKDRDVDLVAECGTVEQAAAELQRTPVDLLFLDVQLARRNGFELLAVLGTHRPPAVVFVTASDHHAIKAFDVEAVDYLLKPFDDQRFAQALARAKERVRHRRAQELAQELAATLTPEVAAPVPPRTLLLKDGARSMFLREDEIDWIEAQDYYVEIHAGGAAHLHREPLRDLEARLDPRKFLRIHRSAIVQIDRIRQVQSLPSGDAAVILRDGTELRISRSRRDAIRAVLGV